MIECWKKLRHTLFWLWKVHVYVHVHCISLRLRDTVGAWFYCQVQLLVATASLHSPHWKQHSMKPVILTDVARAERSTTHVDVNLWRLPPHNFSRQESDLVQKIQCSRLLSLCATNTSSIRQKLFCLTVIVHEKVEISASHGEKWPCVSFLALG